MHASDGGGNQRARMDDQRTDRQHTITPLPIEAVQSRRERQIKMVGIKDEILLSGKGYSGGRFYNCELDESPRRRRLLLLIISSRIRNQLGLLHFPAP